MNDSELKGVAAPAVTVPAAPSIQAASTPAQAAAQAEFDEADREYQAAKVARDATWKAREAEKSNIGKRKRLHREWVSAQQACDSAARRRAAAVRVLEKFA